MTENEFVNELKKINIDCNQDQLDKLEKYYNLLVEWNEKINLTAITEKKDVYLKHFYDSLTLSTIIDLNDQTLCDVGTGAGFPAVVLKIFYPSLKITLIDALEKRIKFLEEVIKELDLQEIICIHARAEEYGIKNREKYDIVTARAVANMQVLLELLSPLAKINGKIILLKGNAREEIEKSTNALKLLNLEVENIKIFELPVEKSTRTIISIKKIKETNKKYPRRYNMIKAKPL